MNARSGNRLLVLQVLVVSLIATLLGRLYVLQVITKQDSVAAASVNQTRQVVTPALRGLILDDQGRELVTNRTSLVVTVDRYSLSRRKDKGAPVLANLAPVIKMPLAQLKARLTLCWERDAVPGRCWSGSEFQAVPVAKDVTDGVALQIMEHREDFPGVTAGLTSIREYPAPLGVNAAHLLGYLGPVTQAELDAQKAQTKTGATALQNSDLVGRAGLESSYDAQLRGVPGVRTLTIDNSARVTGVAGETDPVPGNYLVTSIDARVQAVAEDQLRQAILRARATTDPRTRVPFAADSGSVVVMDPTNGRVIAMASYPSYDPSIWTGGITLPEQQALFGDKSGAPTVFRAIAGEYAPGSTFKVVSTSAAGNAGYNFNGPWDCTSNVTIGNRSFSNDQSEAYGPISVARALEVSCNTVFFRIGYKMWQEDGGINPVTNPKDYMTNEAHSYGLGVKTGIDLPGESSGLITDRAYKLKVWKRSKDIWLAAAKNPKNSAADRALYADNAATYYQWRPGDAANFAIGQGDTLLTPLQLARVYSAVASGGTLWQPQVAKAIVSPNGTVIRTIAPKSLGKVNVSAATLAYIKAAMVGVPIRGTAAGAFKDFPLDQVIIAGKTGSAQVQNQQATSWFASFAPAADPKYVVVMTIHQGGTGAGTSAPSIRKIYEALFGITGKIVTPDKAVFLNAVVPVVLPVIRSDGTPTQPNDTRDVVAAAVPPVTGANGSELPPVGVPPKSPGAKATKSGRRHRRGPRPRPLRARPSRAGPPAEGRSP